MLVRYHNNQVMRKFFYYREACSDALTKYIKIDKDSTWATKNTSQTEKINTQLNDKPAVKSFPI